MRSRWEKLSGALRAAEARACAPMRVGVLCSHRAPGLQHLLDDDPNRGALYDIVCCLTSEDSCAEAGLAAAHGISVLAHPIRRFCEARGYRLSDLTGRAAYDAAMVEHLAIYRLDLVVLTSYLYVITEPMLSFFRHRIINVHHSDLMRRDTAGRAQFAGLRAVRDAILAGEAETRATVHLVTNELDQGPPFLRSWPFVVSPLVHDALAWNATDLLKAYSYAHQEWIIRSTWGPLLASALELVATGHLDLTALAHATPDMLGRPWDLDARGAILGEGPMPVLSPLLAEAR
jgi:phosphoribosylglycinamide formyltransferase-1